MEYRSVVYAWFGAGLGVALLCGAFLGRTGFFAALFGATFLALSGVCAVRFRNSKDLASIFLMLYVTKVTVCFELLLVLPLQKIDTNAVAMGIFAGATAYVAALLLLLRVRSRFLV